MIEVSHLTKYYGDFAAVEDLTFKLVPGEILGFLGPNGAGKSTTLKAISGLLHAEDGEVTGGEIRFNGHSIANADPGRIVRDGIFQVMEGRRTFADLTVDENLVCGGITIKDKSEAADAYQRVMDLFPPLAKRRKNVAGYLSGGEQQMLAIGRALMASPKLLVLDEPSLGLAPKLIEVIRDIIVNINAQGTSVLLIEQNAMMALSIANHGYVMDTGKIVMEGVAKDLLADDDVKEFYLGLHGEATEKRSFRDVKHYRRRKRWAS